MRPLACIIAAGMLAASAFAVHAATPAYGEAFDTLYRIDLAARTATEVGPAGTFSGVPIGNISGLTTLRDGSQYAISGALKLLLQIDPATGHATPVGSLRQAGSGDGQFAALDLGMAADCSDALWLVSGTERRLWKVDRASGALTDIGDTGHAITGLVAHAGVLYGSGSREDHTLYRIDTATGAATAIGPFGADAPAALNSVSMGFAADGTLYAVLNYVPPASGGVTPDWSDLATIDPATGHLTRLGPITGPDALRQVGMKGFTTGPLACGGVPSAPMAAPIGSPWALGLLALLLAGGAWTQRGRLRA